MADLLSRNWWLVVLRGVAAIVFGIMTFVWPGETMAALVIMFGAFALVEGSLAIYAGLTAPSLDGGSRWLLVLEGIAGLIISAITFMNPGVTAAGLLYTIGAWAIITGVLQIVAAIQLRKELSDEWLLILSGILSVAFGVLVYVYPRESAMSIMGLIGFYAVIFGIATMVLGFKMKSVGSDLSTVSSHVSTVGNR